MKRKYFYLKKTKNQTTNPKNKNQNHPHISSGHRIPMLVQTFLLADFRLMCIIQPAACTAVEEKQTDMLIVHPCQDSLPILNVVFLFLLVTLLFFWVLQNLDLQFCLTLSLKLNGKVKLPVWEILLWWMQVWFLHLCVPNCIHKDPICCIL